MAEIDGEMLTDFDIGSFFTLLTIAATTPPGQSLSTAAGLTTHPEQRPGCPRTWRAARRPPVEELVRWATPVATMRRTASRDCELDAWQITRGDKLVIVLQLANRRRAGDRRARTSWTCRGTPTRTSGSGAAASTLPGQPARPIAKFDIPHPSLRLSWRSLNAPSFISFLRTYALH